VYEGKGRLTVIVMGGCSAPVYRVVDGISNPIATIISKISPYIVIACI
jgi:hypothetical protein